MGADRNLEPAWRPIAGSKRRAVGDQEPATFADRGVAVAFTAPRLSQARVRCARRGGLELMVPGYADDGSTYIMPWPAIDQSLGLTAHDHVLHARIGALETVDPWTLRAVQLAVGAEGLAGPQLLQSSRRALEEDRRAWMGAHLDLIALACAANDVQIEALRAEDLAAGELPANVRRAFAGFARSAALSTEDCRRLIVEQSVMFAPLGLGEVRPGRLRLVLQQLHEAVCGLEDWAPTAPSDVTSACGAIAQRCRATIAAAEATIERFDRQANDIVGLVRRWESMAPALRTLVERVYWLLDGWDHVVALWTVGRDGAEARLVDTVQEMRRILPRLPRSEAPAAQVGRAVPGDGSRRLSAMRDWRTGLPDFELARRVEQVRAAVR